MTSKSIQNLPVQPLVVKVGGSLSDHLQDLIPALRSSVRPLLIVPGGGSFADAIRKTRINNDSAHWMAVAAMDQYGWFIASHGIDATQHLKVPVRPVVFLPYCTMRACDPLPHSWDITSDSIAAWTADMLGLDLLVLKSVDGIIRNNRPLKLVRKPAKTDTVDPFFLPFVLEKKVKTTVINGSNRERVEKYLRGEPVACTRIGTTF